MDEKGRCRNSTDHAPWKDKAKDHTPPRGTSCHRRNRCASRDISYHFLVAHNKQSLPQRRVRAHSPLLTSQEENVNL